MSRKFEYLVPNALGSRGFSLNSMCTFAVIHDICANFAFIHNICQGIYSVIHFELE